VEGTLLEAAGRDSEATEGVRIISEGVKKN